MKPSCQVKNEDAVGAAPTGDAPTTSEWSTILLPTKVRFILEVWRYIKFHAEHYMAQEICPSILMDQRNTVETPVH